MKTRTRCILLAMALTYLAASVASIALVAQVGTTALGLVEGRQ